MVDSCQQIVYENDLWSKLLNIKNIKINANNKNWLGVKVNTSSLWCLNLISVMHTISIQGSNSLLYSYYGYRAMST